MNTIAALNRGARVLDDQRWSADALERLIELRGAREHIDVLIDSAVIDCRTNGQASGGTDDVPDSEALGMTRQRAWQRFRHLL
jgi:hypothetical protein